MLLSDDDLADIVAASAFFAAATAILAKIGVKGVEANVASAVRTCVVLVFTWLLVYLARHMPRIAQTITDLNVRSRTFRFVTPAASEACKIPNASVLCHKEKDKCLGGTAA